MRYADMTRFAGMNENVVASPHAPQRPAVRFKLFNELLAIHGGYYTHHVKLVNENVKVKID